MPCQYSKRQKPTEYTKHRPPQRTLFNLHDRLGTTWNMTPKSPGNSPKASTGRCISCRSPEVWGESHEFDIVETGLPILWRQDTPDRPERRVHSECLITAIPVAASHQIYGTERSQNSSDPNCLRSQDTFCKNEHDAIEHREDTVHQEKTFGLERAIKSLQDVNHISAQSNATSSKIDQYCSFNCCK